MQGLIALLAGAGLSALVIRAMIAIAPRVGLVDHPGEHKQHEHVTPFVGGFGVLAALLVAVALLILEYPDRLVAWLSLLVCGVVMFGVGLADDRWKLSARIRLVIQAGLALLMVYGGGVVLADVGDAFFVGALTMGFAAAVPFTVFGTVGCINALNMVDGIDGLSGTIAAGTLALIALVAGLGGDGATFLLALCLLGGVLGFLWFNLRFGDQLRARVFMGDNGSMTLGLLLCWLLITITQGPNALVPPIVALWIFALPLVDTLSVMFRRMWMGKSPFSPDRNHLHHLLQRAGFRVENTVGIMGTLHFALGATGIAGAWLGVPEGVLAIGWLVVFLAYFRLTARPWRFVPMLRGFHRACRPHPRTQPRRLHGQLHARARRADQRPRRPPARRKHRLPHPALPAQRHRRPGRRALRRGADHHRRRGRPAAPPGPLHAPHSAAPPARSRASTCAATSTATPTTNAAPAPATSPTTAAAPNAASPIACWSKNPSPTSATAASSTSRSTTPRRRTSNAPAAPI